MKRNLIALIRAYQLVLSPIMGLPDKSRAAVLAEWRPV